MCYVIWNLHGEHLESQIIYFTHGCQSYFCGVCTLSFETFLATVCTWAFSGDYRRDDGVSFRRFWSIKSWCEHTRVPSDINTTEASSLMSTTATETVDNNSTLTRLIAREDTVHINRHIRKQVMSTSSSMVNRMSALLCSFTIPEHTLQFM
jgi:hypothetical protein